jgi:hypothetical protein
MAAAPKKTTTDAGTKAKHTGILQKLNPIAKKINARLASAAKMDDKAYDHRLAAALELDAAKTQCGKSKINFKKWCEDNITQSYETVRKLTAVGGAADPQKALEDLRGKNKIANKKLRARKVVVSRETTTATEKSTPFSRITEGFKAIPDAEGANLVKAQAESYGLAVVTAGEAGAARKAKERLTQGALVQVKAIFKLATAEEKIEIAAWTATQIGAEFKDGHESTDCSIYTIPEDVDQAEGDLEMPDFLARA